MKKIFRRLTSTILLVAMCCGGVPTTALAAPTVTSNTITVDSTAYSVMTSTHVWSDAELTSAVQDLANAVKNDTQLDAPGGTPEEYCVALSGKVNRSLGVSNVTISNLNYYLAALSYLMVEQQDTNSGIDYTAAMDSTSDYSKFVDDALSISIPGASYGDAVNSLFDSIYDVSKFGILNDGYTKTAHEGNAGTLNSIALYKCIYAYIDGAANGRQDVLSRLGAGSSTVTADDDIRWLAAMKLVHDTFGIYYPIISEVSKLTASGEDTSNPTLEDLWKDNSAAIKDVKPEFYITDDFVKPTILRETPLTKFYNINSRNGIVFVERDTILNDIEYDVNALEIEEYYDDSRKTDKEIDDGDVGAIDYSWTKVGNFGIPADVPDSNSLYAVTMSEYIQKGMIYSSTFVPMKTNLYSPDTINQFDKDFRDEFFYKYGFMRKALLRDTSSTSAVDYYNADGVCTGTLQVCTLRDIMESNGNDLTLYLDDNFYNADEAIKKGNEQLQLLYTKRVALTEDLRQLYDVFTFTKNLVNSLSGDVNGVSTNLKGVFKTLFDACYTKADLATVSEAAEDVKLYMNSKYKYNTELLETTDLKTLKNQLADMDTAVSNSGRYLFDYEVLKHEDNSIYSDFTKALLDECAESDYRQILYEDASNDENYDTIVLPSREITDYMDGVSNYAQSFVNDGQVVTNLYSSYDSYSPMLSLSYVSALYRDGNSYSLANAVSTHNPVFIASDDLCGIDGAGQWYRNTILNYALVQNLKSSTTLDYNYVVDLDCPVYMDVFGNILTEGGTVVIPAASNMTLHPASYKLQNVSVGLYSVYGHDYHVPLTCKGASTAMYPYFTIDPVNEVYIINGVSMDVGEVPIKFNELSPNDPDIQDTIQKLYSSYINGGTPYNRLNWITMVNISNEVMRGAPIENIDKDIEGLDVNGKRNRAGVVAAVKLEELIDSLEGTMQNTLISIPDFTRNEHTEYLVAFMIKILIVLVTASIIIGIYRDGVSGELGIRTFYKTVTSVLIVFSAVCLIPALFTLTYYTANKFLLHDEAMRILMYNLEKQQCGVEIGMTDVLEPGTTNDMALQLDWIEVPWYDQLENVLYKSSLQNLDEVKQKAYRQSPVYDHFDVELHDDGVYVTVDELFSAVNIDYTFNEMYDGNDTLNGLYLYADNSLQTAGFYTPYYVFLRVLTANVNEYNYYHNSYNYTTKYISGNRLKTVGLCNTYFTTKGFMEEDTDIMHMYEIYGDPKNVTYDRALLFSDSDLESIQNSMWYCNFEGKGLDRRVELMNDYARDFIADNKDLLTKVTDETFIKVMALNMAIKYNQVFGVPAANSLEIYNMDSNDLLRLSIVKTEEAVLAAPMSYSRFVYNFGGEPAVYCAAVLTLIMWLGSFIKPLCTIIIFLSTCLSLVVFRVVLRKPSANLLGYLVTILLLCFTNVLHAVLLKVSTYLPNIGLSPLGCIIFLIIAQVVYLLFLSYITGVSLKDWQNLGMTEYEHEARTIKRKFGADDAHDLSGSIPHHENNWDYYNDLLKQHRSRNM